MNNGTFDTLGLLTLLMGPLHRELVLGLSVALGTVMHQEDENSLNTIGLPRRIGLGAPARPRQVLEGLCTPQTCDPGYKQACRAHECTCDAIPDTALSSAVPGTAPACRDQLCT
jgi:hypothetical protein